MSVDIEWMVGIWTEVLGRPVGRQDDFFVDLGGTSLQATEILFAVEDDLGVELKLGVLFDNPTPAALVEAVVAHSAP